MSDRRAGMMRHSSISMLRCSGRPGPSSIDLQGFGGPPPATFRNGLSALQCTAVFGWLQSASRDMQDPAWEVKALAPLSHYQF